MYLMTTCFYMQGYSQKCDFKDVFYPASLNYMQIAIVSCASATAYLDLRSQ